MEILGNITKNWAWGTFESWQKKIWDLTSGSICNIQTYTNYQYNGIQWQYNIYICIFMGLFENMVHLQIDRKLVIHHHFPHYMAIKRRYTPFSDAPLFWVNL